MMIYDILWQKYTKIKIFSVLFSRLYRSIYGKRSKVL